MVVIISQSHEYQPHGGIRRKVRGLHVPFGVYGNDVLIHHLHVETFH